MKAHGIRKLALPGAWTVLILELIDRSSLRSPDVSSHKIS